MNVGAPVLRSFLTVKRQNKKAPLTQG